MKKSERYSGILDWFERNMPLAQTELHYNDPFQLLVAVILSAQCTDKRVNMVTPPLFEKYTTPLSLASATYDEVFPYLKSVSYPNSKTRHVIAMASKLLEDFGGEVPSDIDSLMSLPGVGRKTANVVSSVAFNKPAIAVDTHVFRVSNRLRIAVGETPLEVEKGLQKLIPKESWSDAHHWLIWHGRNLCQSRRPKCSKCFLNDLCPSKSENVEEKK